MHECFLFDNLSHSYRLFIELIGYCDIKCGTECGWQWWWWTKKKLSDNDEAYEMILCHTRITWYEKLFYSITSPTWDCLIPKEEKNEKDTRQILSLEKQHRKILSCLVRSCEHILFVTVPEARSENRTHNSPKLVGISKQKGKLLLFFNWICSQTKWHGNVAEQLASFGPKWNLIRIEQHLPQFW